MRYRSCQVVVFNIVVKVTERRAGEDGDDEIVGHHLTDSWVNEELRGQGQVIDRLTGR